MFLASFCIFFELTMPPKSKRARQSLQAGEKGREAQKKAKLKAEAGENVAECTQHEHTTASASESAATLERSGPLSESTISTAAEPEVTPDTRTHNKIIGDFVDGWVNETNLITMLYSVRRSNVLVVSPTCSNLWFANSMRFNPCKKF